MTTYAASLLGVVLYASIRALAIGIVVKGLLSGLRVSSAGVRQSVWAAVLIAMLLMPVLPSALWFVEVPIDFPATTTTAPEDRPVATSIEPRPSNPVGAKGPELAADAARERAIVNVSDAAPGRRMLPTIVAAVYVGGAIALIVRLLVGWWAARRIYRSSAPIPDLPAYESPAVVVPVTIGVVAPRIILPADWTRWPAAMLETVLAHELAHVRRRDTAIALAARINTCLFWFHPMAWWLRRELSVTAELACDAPQFGSPGPDATPKCCSRSPTQHTALAGGSSRTASAWAARKRSRRGSTRS